MTLFLDAAAAGAAVEAAAGVAVADSADTSDATTAKAVSALLEYISDFCGNSASVAAACILPST